LCFLPALHFLCSPAGFFFPSQLLLEVGLRALRVEEACLECVGLRPELGNESLGFGHCFVELPAVALQVVAEGFELREIEVPRLGRALEDVRPAARVDGVGRIEPFGAQWAGRSTRVRGDGELSHCRLQL